MIFLYYFSINNGIKQENLILRDNATLAFRATCLATLCVKTVDRRAPPNLYRTLQFTFNRSQSVNLEQL